MWLGSDAALRAYMEALSGELDRLAARLAPGRSRDAARRLRTVRGALDPERPATTRRQIRALHRLAMVAEDQGWLTPDEVLVVRKLAYRIAFYLRRRREAGRDGPVHPPDLRY